MEQLQPGMHPYTAICRTGTGPPLPAYHLAQPLLDFWVTDVVVVDPALVACIVGRIDVDTLHLALILGQQGFEGSQIIPVNNHVPALIGVIGIVDVQHLERDFQVVVDDLIFPNPFQYGHSGLSSYVSTCFCGAFSLIILKLLSVRCTTFFSARSACLAQVLTVCSFRNSMSGSNCWSVSHVSRAV